MKKTCSHCNHKFEYKGTSKWFTKCPKCKKAVVLKENTLDIKPAWEHERVWGDD